jgi:hypothetical protein
MRPRADRQRPRVARRVGQLKVRVEPDRDRHRFRAHIDDGRLDFEHAVVQAMRDLDRVRERPLFHPHRLLVGIEAARDPRRFSVRLRLEHLPLIGAAHETMNRNIACDVAELHVEGVPLAVGVERLFVEAVRPRREQRDAV